MNRTCDVSLELKPAAKRDDPATGRPRNIRYVTTGGGRFILTWCRAATLTTAYSISEAKTKTRHMIIQTSIALMYETLGSDSRAAPLMVVVVSTVSKPSETRAGLASMLIQNETHDRMTIRIVGT